MSAMIRSGLDIRRIGYMHSVSLIATLMQSTLRLASNGIFPTLICMGVAAANPETNRPFEAVQVTATREPETIGRVPASISVVTGDELRARGADDLRTALSLVSGVEGT